MTNILQTYLRYKDKCGDIKKMYYNQFYVYYLKCRGMDIIGIALPKELKNFLIETWFDIKMGISRYDITKVLNLVILVKCRVIFDFEQRIIRIL